MIRISTSYFLPCAGSWLWGKHGWAQSVDMMLSPSPGRGLWTEPTTQGRGCWAVMRLSMSSKEPLSDKISHSPSLFPVPLHSVTGT